jgi:FtsZ-interacting cell division protein ZipA
MPTWLIWVIVIVVVVLAVVAIVSMTSKRRTEQHRTRADELRAEASAKAGGLTESQRAADEAEAKAELAEAEAQRAREQAASAEQSHQVEQASYEDKLREADRLDPDVNTGSKEYEPSVWNDETTSPPDPAGAHRATTPEAEVSETSEGETRTAE